ncbi:MAG: hypothetical protein CL940_00050, partial [Deltaproteobacteria bacterium]|nr:hypothetical protein [Deltaproteobacteria bacterium]
MLVAACSPADEAGTAPIQPDAAQDAGVPEAPVTLHEAPLLASTPTELNNTYRDLLGFSAEGSQWPPTPEIAKTFAPTDNETLGVFGTATLKPDPWPWVFPAEAGEDGFEGLAGGQQPSAFSVETLQKAATHYAAYALVSERFVECDAVTQEPLPEPEGPTWADARPVLEASCGGCHGGAGSGGSDFASVYADNLAPSSFCDGETVGACVISRIQDGSMPPNGKTAGVSGADLALLETWVAAGMPDAPPTPGLWSGVPEDAKASCGWTSVERFAERAWRRPLDVDERERLQTLWANNWAEGSPEEAVVLTVSAVLQSPSFLFRVERGEPERAQGDAVPLTDHEMATRLSYFLWDSMPDDLLFAAAAAG